MSTTGPYGILMPMLRNNNNNNSRPTIIENERAEASEGTSSRNRPTVDVNRVQA
ncbi:37373_t:CDS:1, partial [Gigaspora margarita]